MLRTTNINTTKNMNIERGLGLLLWPALLVLLSQSSCDRAAEHSHGASDDGHDHDTPSEVHTIWTDRVELFVEFPALVVGRTSQFAAHLTELEGHQPVREGSVTAILIQGAKGIRHTVEAPSSPGIFKPVLEPTSAGEHSLVFELNTPKGKERITVGNVTVFSNSEEAKEAIGTSEESSAITFLKEQAWKMPFQTAPVTAGPIYDVIKTSGVWKIAPKDARSLVATTSGVVELSESNLTAGTAVKRGQSLMTLRSNEFTSDNLASEVEQARATYEQLKNEYERKKELHESNVVPASEFEQVRSRYLVAKSNYETLNAGQSAGGKSVVAPFDGIITSIAVNNGSYARQGNVLMTISATNAPLLESQISPMDKLSKSAIVNVWYKTSLDRWSDIRSTGGKVLSLGKEVDASHPMIPVYVQVNEAVERPIGSFTEVMIAHSPADSVLTIPTSAVLEHFGDHAVIVQISGEQYERRPVILGRTNGDRVEVKQGLDAGEYVVTEGAYQVKMASMSGQVPAHGHTH